MRIGWVIVIVMSFLMGCAFVDGLQHRDAMTPTQANDKKIRSKPENNLNTTTTANEQNTPDERVGKMLTPITQ